MKDESTRVYIQDACYELELQGAQIRTISPVLKNAKTIKAESYRGQR